MNRLDPERRFTNLIGKRVAKRRTQLKLTQSALAAKAGAGWYRQLVGRLEKGEQMPTLFQLQALAVALEMSLSALVELQQSSSASKI